MLRGDSGVADVRAGRRLHARRVSDFIREAGVYRIESRSHVNRYQLFVERALQVDARRRANRPRTPVRHRLDSGSGPLRRHLFDHAEVDSVTGLNNRAGLFAIHRSLRFVPLTATTGRSTSSIGCQFGMTRTENLERDDPPIVVTRHLLERLSGLDDLGIPEIASDRDLRILETITSRTRWLGASEGWNVRFGRELNASDDRGAFREFTGSVHARPVLEGKHLQPFRAALTDCRHELVEERGVSLRVPRGPPRVSRYRQRHQSAHAHCSSHSGTCGDDHTLFCLRTVLPSDAQHVLCAILNSFVANYLVRSRRHGTSLYRSFHGFRSPRFTRDIPCFSGSHVSRVRSPKAMHRLNQWVNTPSCRLRSPGSTVSIKPTSNTSSERFRSFPTM